MFALRAVAALGALLVFLSLFATWFFDRAPEPDEPLTAWENYSRTDVLLALLALAALVGCALPPRPSRIVRLGAGGAAAAIVVRALVQSDPGRGARLALAGALVVLAATAAELVPERRRAQAAGAAAAALRWARRWAVSTPVLALGVWIVAAPLVPLGPSGGTDGSWITALHLARHDGLDFGSQIAYTYGPLGFLTVPRVYYQGQAVAGWLYVVIAYYALAVTVLAAARRTMPVLVAVVVTVAALECFRIVSPDEQTQFAVVAMTALWALALLRADDLHARRWWPVAAAAGGGFAALESMVKLNSGVTIALVLAIAFVAAAGPERRRTALAFGAGFAVTFLVTWLAAGQSLGAIDDYLQTSKEIISGFADFQYDEKTYRFWEYPAAAIIAVGLAVLAWRGTGTWSLGARTGALAVTALVLFSAFKQGFVRHDAHSLFFFATTLVLATGLASRANPPLATWLAVGGSFVAFVAAAQPKLYEFHQPRHTWSFTRDAVDVLRHPEAVQEAALADVRSRQRIPDEALRAIGERPVHVFPTESSVAWTQPQLNWRPLPIFQGFQAYTRELDERNAAMLRSGRAPERLLRSREYSPFEDPEALMQVACRYTEVFARDDWQVLARGPDRCGRPTLAARVEADTEQDVPVPPVADDELLYFRVHGMGKSLREKVQSFLWKADERDVVFDGERVARIAPSLADRRNLLKVGARADYSGGFRLSLPPKAIRFRIATHGVLARQKFRVRPVTVEFYRVPLSRPGIVEGA